MPYDMMGYPSTRPKPKVVGRPKRDRSKNKAQKRARKR